MVHESESFLEIMMPRKYTGKRLVEKSFIYIRSENFSIADDPYRRFEVDVNYSEEDWNALAEEANSLSLAPEKFFEERMKRAVRPRASMSRVEDGRDRRRLYDGYGDFWFPFIKYLIFAHISVVISGAVVEFILGTGKTYIFFYWSYVGTLILALISWLGYRFHYIIHRGNHHSENEQSFRFELILAKMSERLMWTSFWVFVISVLGRIAIGLYGAWKYLELPVPSRMIT